MSYWKEFLYGHDPTDYYGDIKACIAFLTFELVLVVCTVGIIGMIK